jgi:hypothetical protein
MSRAILSLSPWYLPPREDREGALGIPVSDASWVQLEAGDLLVLEQPFALLGYVDWSVFGAVHLTGVLLVTRSRSGAGAPRS